MLSLYLLAATLMAIGYNYYSSNSNNHELIINYGLAFIAVTASITLTLNKQDQNPPYIEQPLCHRDKCIAKSILKHAVFSLFVVTFVISAFFAQTATPPELTTTPAQTYPSLVMNNLTLIAVLILITLITKGSIKLNQIQNNQIQKINLDKKCYKLSDSSKSKFIASMAHDLKSPLSSILGFNQLLKMELEGTIAKEHLQYFNDIDTSGKHLKNLIEKTLEFCKSEDQKICLQPEKIDIEKAINTCLSIQKNAAAQKNITIVDNLKQLPVLNITTDTTRFKQIFLNFLSNAIKYNKTNGSVILDYKLINKKTMRFLISDSGFGIPKKMQNKVFTPFNRLHFETSSIDGTGLGLSTTKELIEYMGGTVGFHSEEGKGSTFWFELPIIDTH